MYKICCKGTHILLNNNQVQSFFSQKTCVLTFLQRGEYPKNGNMMYMSWYLRCFIQYRVYWKK